MSIPLLVYYVLAKMMSAIESAPLGNGISDPLVSSVELPDGDKLSNEMLLSIFRRNIHEEIIDTGNYDGYIYNHNRCIQFNNRILCGYDKNKGYRLDDYTMIDMGSGCRTRGDRIECGYDNPPRTNINLRHPDFKNLKHREDEEHGKLDVPHGKHDIPHEEHDDSYVPHHNHRHHRDRRHDDKHHTVLARQAPTRTAMTTDPTVLSTILDGSESDYLEIKLLKSALDKLVLKGKYTKIKGVKLATTSIKPINLATDAVKPVTTTTIQPIKRESTLTPKSSKATKTTSTAEITKTTSTAEITKATSTAEITKTTSTAEITKTTSTAEITKPTSTSEITKILATHSESNNASDGQTIKRIRRRRRQAQRKKQKRRRLIETFSDLPVSIGTIFDTTTVSPISKPCKKRNEENLSTTCVEQGDRIVCYGYNT